MSGRLGKLRETYELCTKLLQEAREFLEEAVKSLARTSRTRGVESREA